MSRNIDIKKLGANTQIEVGTETLIQHSPWASKAITKAIYGDEPSISLPEKIGTAVLVEYDKLPEAEKQRFDVLDVTVAHLRAHNILNPTTKINILDVAIAQMEQPPTSVEKTTRLEFMLQAKEEMIRRDAQSPGLFGNWQESILHHQGTFQEYLQDLKTQHSPWARKAIVNALANSNSQKPLHQRVGEAVLEEYNKLPESEKKQFDALEITIAHLEALYEEQKKSHGTGILDNILTSTKKIFGIVEGEKMDFNNPVNEDFAEELKSFYKNLKDAQKHMPQKAEKFPELYQNWQEEALVRGHGAKAIESSKTLEKTIKDFFEQNKDSKLITSPQEYKYALCDHLIRSEKTGLLHVPFRIEEVARKLEEHKTQIPKRYRDNILQEFKIASSLSCDHHNSPLEDKCYIDTKKKTSLTAEQYRGLSELDQQSVVERSWNHGGWLVELRDKHAVQWALEKNDQLLKANKASLSLNGIAILDHADKLGIEFYNRYGAEVSAVEFCVQENLQITPDQNIMQYIGNKPTMSKYRDNILQTLNTQERLDDYMAQVLQDPYMANAHDVALDLLTSRSGISTPYADLLDESIIRSLCQSSGIKFGEYEYTLPNLLKKSAEKGVVEYHAVKNSIAEACYQKGAELEEKIKIIDNPDKQGLLDKLSQKIKGIDHFSERLEPEMPRSWNGPGAKSIGQDEPQQDPSLKKYSTARLKRVQERINKMKENGRDTSKYNLLEERITLTLSARESIKKPLLDQQQKYDQIYDLLTVPPITDQAIKAERKRDPNCKLLTEKTSEFYKLYEKHGAQRLANRFHANKALDKSFLNKVAGKMKLIAGATLAGAATGIVTQVGSGSKTVGAVAGIATGVVAVGVGSAVQKVSDASQALTDAGRVDFIVADEGKYQSVCSAKVRRAIEDVTIREEKLGIQARHNPLIRTGRLIEQKAQHIFSSKAQGLDDAIEKSGTQMENAYEAFDKVSNQSWLEAIDAAKKKGHAIGEKTYNIVVSGTIAAFQATSEFFKGLSDAHQKAAERQEGTAKAAGKWSSKFSSRKMDKQQENAWTRHIESQNNDIPSSRALPTK